MLSKGRQIPAGKMVNLFLEFDLKQRYIDIKVRKSKRHHVVLLVYVGKEALMNSQILNALLVTTYLYCNRMSGNIASASRH